MWRPFRLPFWATALVMLGGLVWLAIAWSQPLRYLLEVRFTLDRYAFEGHGALIREAIVKMYLVAVFLTVVVVPAVALLRWLTPLATTRVRSLFLALTGALMLFPVSAMLLACLGSLQYLLAMGITANRLKGVGIGLLGMSCFASGAWVLICSLRREQDAHLVAEH